jgi:transcription elongation factor Elf1
MMNLSKGGIIMMHQGKHLDMRAIVQMYSTPKQAEHFFFKMKWPSKFICRRCGCSHYVEHESQDGYLYECRNCHLKESIVAYTVMEGVDASLSEWIFVMFLEYICQGSLSLQALSDLSGVDKQRLSMMRSIIATSQLKKIARYIAEGRS